MKNFYKFTGDRTVNYRNYKINEQLSDYLYSGGSNLVVFPDPQKRTDVFGYTNRRDT
ncbi:hypothetical protein [Pedobacter sp. JCM 36344]|uniref:hypothetical protein n=1 Tax=Pedobacter sp. JCM 36344 TaxID=3374280 RepID=UPI003978BB03